MTNDIQDIYFDSIIFNLNAGTPKDVLKKLSVHISKLIGTPASFLQETLIEQEKEHSSAIGNGVAIPHMRLPRLTKPMIIFARINKAVDFEAVDNEPVDMVCLVLSPEFEGPKHLSRLAKISRFFSQDKMRYQLHQAKDSDEIRLMMKTLSTRKLAA